MNRDPFYCQIEQALAGPLDPEQFERCVVLRAIYPPLVPIRGGQDGGRDGDGALPDGSGFPFVTTIGDPSSNLRKNLRSHRTSGRKERVCVLATRHVLNADARAKLEAPATRQGYRLVRVHDGPEWRPRLQRLLRDDKQQEMSF
jgi:hypothetical protein